jgi:predicted ATPase
VAFALHWTALIHQLRREGHAARERAEATVALCNEQGFPMYLAWATILQGWALTEQGRGEEGIVQIRQGLADTQAMGTEAFRTYFFALLAEAYGKTGRVEDGLNVVAEALTVADKIGERWYEAELYRLKGELLLAQEIKNQKARGKSQKSGTPNPKSQSLEPSAGAEECFLKAIDIAQKQQAKSLELRAVMSLVRLRRRQAAQSASRTTQHETRAKLEESHKMLSDVYNWFTEGFATKDLQEAKALIDESNR